jgi:hypothetical protein
VGGGGWGGNEKTEGLWPFSLVFIAVIERQSFVECVCDVEDKDGGIQSDDWRGRSLVTSLVHCT